jgi:hypothetical protein
MSVVFPEFEVKPPTATIVGFITLPKDAALPFAKSKVGRAAQVLTLPAIQKQPQRRRLSGQVNV